MKTFIALFIFTLSFLTISPDANAGVPERAIRAALKSSLLRPRPVISEMDIMKYLRQAQSRARGEHMSPEIDIIARKIPNSTMFGEKSFFRSSVTSQSEYAKTSSKRVDLIFDVKGIDAGTKRRIRSLVAGSDWNNIGHFDSRITALQDSGDDLFIKLELIGVKSTDFNNIRGIRKVVDEAFKLAMESKAPVVKPTLTRPMNEAVLVGAN